MTTREIVMSAETEAMFENRPPEYDFQVIPKLAAIYTIGTDDDWTGTTEYIVCKGGRGGGKSESIAQMLILLSRREATRILCTREIQKSMKDSVKKMLVFWINEMGLSAEFHITDNAIVNLETGTDFIFMGMETAAADRSDALKSLAGVKYVWYEEAQTATMHSLEKLDPTIRVPGRKLIFSMNPRSTFDAVPVFLTSYIAPEMVYTIEINYWDNHFLYDIDEDGNNNPLITQAESMKELDHDRWSHIWAGQPVPEDSSRIILPFSWLKQCVDLHLKEPGDDQEQYKLRDFRTTGGFDVAEGTTTAHDKNALALRKGPTITHTEEWQIDEVYQSVAHIDTRHLQLGFDRLWFDAVGVGTAAKSEFDRLNKTRDEGLPYKVYPFKGSNAVFGKDKPFTGEGRNVITNGAMFKNAKAQSWWNLRLRLENSMKLLKGEKIDRKDYYLSFSSDIKDLDSIFLELAQATYDEDNSGKLIVDKAPGIHTVVVEGKDKERKSPNKADAIVYSFADDLDGGLRAHQPKSRKMKVIG